MSELLRNMVRRKTRTALTVFGIVIGVLALTVMGAMVEYFNTLLDAGERLSGTNVSIQPATRAADDQLTTVTMRRLRQVDGVAEVSNLLGTLLTEENVTVSFGPLDQVTGVDPSLVRQLEPGVTLRAGRWLDPGDTYHMVVGSRIAANKHLDVGSVFTWRKKDYEVVGIMATTNTIPDSTALMPFETLRKELKIPVGTVGAISVIPEPGVDPEMLATRINEEVPRVKAQSPREQINQVRQALATFNAIMVGSALIAVVVGGLSVANTMVMAVKERTREIGIKKAIGATNGDIIRELVAESGVMGIFGGLVGLGLAWALIGALNAAMAANAGNGAPVWTLTLRLAVGVLAFASVLGTLAGVLPAWGASRLDPVEALHAE